MILNRRNVSRCLVCLALRMQSKRAQLRSHLRLRDWGCCASPASGEASLSANSGAGFSDWNKQTLHLWDPNLEGGIWKKHGNISVRSNIKDFEDGSSASTDLHQDNHMWSSINTLYTTNTWSCCEKKIKSEASFRQARLSLLHTSVLLKQEGVKDGGVEHLKAEL